MILNEDDDLEKVYKELKENDAKRHKNLVQRLRDLDDSEDSASFAGSLPASSFLPSSLLNEKPKKEKDRKEVVGNGIGYGYGVKDSDDYDPDLWFEDMMYFSSPKSNSGKNARKNMFDSMGIKEVKKKKKKGKTANDGTPLTDFKKEFEPDMALFKNLLVEQNKFTASLQKDYDQIHGTKSSARGMSKQLTDLVENITAARSLSMQLIEKNVQAKKLIAELSMKQRKEFGNGTDLDNPDAMNDFASTYLRNMLDNRRTMMDPTNAEIVDMDESGLFDELTQSLALSGDERSEETDMYLKYEGQNVTTYIRISKDATGKDDLTNYTFETYTEDGELIPDYPEPTHTEISLNRSTNIATDAYGKKFHVLYD